MKSIIRTILELLRQALSASIELFKVMIPILIGVKILQELGLIQYIALPLKPVMGLVGLPAEMGLVWASALINNIYTGIIVLASLIQDNPLTGAQATVLAVLMLVGHNLPVECAIAKKSGARFLFQCAMRLIGAFVLAWLLHITYAATGTLQAPTHMIFSTDAAAADPTLAAWALGQVKNLASIFCIILGLLTIMRILQAVGVIELMNRILRPILKQIGIGPKASAITVIGLTMGISYGGGLIINESKSGRVSKEDVFYSLTLMGLCHSLIEDTLLLLLIGGHVSGILWGRMIFALLAMTVVVHVVRRLPQTFRNTYLWAAD
ncbi:nucleoside recognition domain-containing protein [Pseudodesulfovibrio sp.]|uniref:nucleoside recognition domain-containing protein n=1 Tax=unclassified Pseudodesulfovibrio TaxID=2661612 RepID=UPI003AFFD89F